MLRFRANLFRVSGISALASLAGLLISFFSTIAYAETGPLASVPNDFYDFGRVMQGQRVVHEFEVRNIGDADLALQRIAPSCGCTAAAVTSSTIKPGTSEKVRVTFDTSGMFGDKTKTVSILTNARENQELTLKLKGSVARGVTVTPERLVFGELSQGASLPARTQEVTLKVNEGVSWEVERVTTSSRYLTINEMSSVNGARRYSVSVQPDAPKGELRERLLVEFKDTATAPVNIPVTAIILGDLKLSPSIVSFGIISGADPIERRVKYENSSSNPVKITEVTSSHPAVTASMLEMDSGQRGVLAIKVDPKKVKGDLRATVQVKTTHPEQSALTISVYGVEPPK
jgi:hypothetical protein